MLSVCTRSSVYLFESYLRAPQASGLLCSAAKGCKTLKRPSGTDEVR